MKRRYSKKPEKQQRLAKERIDILFEQAKKVFEKEPELADRYVELARKIAMKYKVKIPSRLKRQFCKHCYKFLIPGNNCRVRLYRGKLVYYCHNCKNFFRMPYRALKRS